MKAGLRRSGQWLLRKFFRPGAALLQHREIAHQRVEHDGVFNAVAAVNDLVAQPDREGDFGQPLTNFRVSLHRAQTRLAKNLKLALNGRTPKHVGRH